jgi:hypothetical protein
LPAGGNDDPLVDDRGRRPITVRPHDGPPAWCAGLCGLARLFTPKLSARDYVISLIPSVVIIDPAGKVRHIGLMHLTEGIDIPGKIKAILREFNLPFPAGA